MLVVHLACGRKIHKSRFGDDMVLCYVRMAVSFSCECVHGQAGDCFLDDGVQ